MPPLDYPHRDMPAPGTTLEVAPGVHWLSMPLPFKLDHINLWLLEDDGAWTIVDTGIGNDETRALWEKLLPKEVKRIILTHYHPDHAGNAQWLCERFGAELWTTQGEYLTAHAVRERGAGYTTEAVLAVFRKNGLDEERALADREVWTGADARQPRLLFADVGAVVTPELLERRPLLAVPADVLALVLADRAVLWLVRSSRELNPACRADIGIRLHGVKAPTVRETRPGALAERPRV